MRASGTFDLKIMPQGKEDREDGSTLSRMSLDKQFHGDLEASSKGEMLSALTEVKGSGGYVAIERVRGTLNGKNGSFVLQHSGIMRGEKQQLSLMVVQDSGSGQLIGLSGKMEIRIIEGKHYYDFDYELAEAGK